MEYKQYLIELNRGVILLAVLTSLKKEKYSLELVKYLESNNYPIDQNTLYPMLRRLNKQNILSSETKYENGRNRKYYSLTAEGIELLCILEEKYLKQNKIITSLIKENNE